MCEVVLKATQRVTLEKRISLTAREQEHYHQLIESGAPATAMDTFMDTLVARHGLDSLDHVTQSSDLECIEIIE